jgi:hypothetical protein
MHAWYRCSRFAGLCFAKPSHPAARHWLDSSVPRESEVGSHGRRYKAMAIGSQWGFFGEESAGVIQRYLDLSDWQRGRRGEEGLRSGAVVCGKFARMRRVVIASHCARGIFGCGHHRRRGARGRILVSSRAVLGRGRRHGVRESGIGSRVGANSLGVGAGPHAAVFLGVLDQFGRDRPAVGGAGCDDFGRKFVESERVL